MPSFVLILLLAVAAEATPLIHQLVYDGPGADGDDVFTQLSGPPGMSLNGWTLAGVNGNSGQVYRRVGLTGLVFSADGLVLLAPAQATGAVLLNRDLLAAVDWQNGPDAIHLLDAAGRRVDALQYGVAPFFAGNGAPAPDVAPGWGLVRRVLGRDSGDNGVDFLAVANPLPTLIQAAPVPEPTALLLLLTGSILLFMWRCSSRK